MKITFILTLALLLVSCGGGGSSNNNNVSTASIIEVQLFEATSNFERDDIPVVGVQVQLDYDGLNITSDQNGVVIFDIDDNEKHDIHIFSKPGYEWQSIYNVTKGVAQRIRLVNTNSEFQASLKSYISFKGRVSNFVVQNKYEYYFYESFGNAHKGTLVPTNGNVGVDYQIYFEFDLPAASSVNGDIVVLEYQYDINTNEQILINSTVVPATAVIQYTTNARNDSYILQDDIVFPLTAPLQSQILTIQDIIVPLASRFTILDITPDNNSAIDLSSQPVGSLYRRTSADVVYPQMLQSYSSYDYPSVAYSVSALIDSQPIYNLIWSLHDVVDRKSSVTISPTFSVLPVLLEGQTGEIIKWTGVDSSLTSLDLRITEIVPANPIVAWNLKLDPTATQVRLPKVPTGTDDIFMIGSFYVTRLNGESRVLRRIESFSLESKNWSR